MRIISGTARGSKLKAPKGLTTRPTADRIKESLFNILQPHLSDKIVLDLFAGSGALGLEALSRGAQKAYFIDRDRDSLLAVKSNIEHTHQQEKAVVCAGDVFQQLGVLKRKQVKCDLIFSDPPYHKGLTEQILLYLTEHDLINVGGFLVLEMGQDEKLPEISHLWEIWRSRNYGKTTVIHILQRREEEKNESAVSGQF